MKRTQLVFLALSLVTGMLAVSACHAGIGMSPSAVNRPLSLPQFIVGVVTRSGDLTYITEQDSEVFAFYRNTPVKELTDSVFLSLLRRPTNAKIVRQSWSTFFQLRTQNDPTGRWKNLQTYLEGNLTELTVFRLPRAAPYESQYDLYAVGIFNGDTVVGVQMFGVAT